MADFKFDKIFNFAHRELIAEIVKDKLISQLVGLRIDWSYECGFNLPLLGTPWVTKDYGDYSNSIIQYHDSRQLRFHSSDGKIIDGLRFKDGIRYWSDNEVELVVNMVNQVIKQLNL